MLKIAWIGKFNAVLGHRSLFNTIEEEVQNSLAVNSVL